MYVKVPEVKRCCCCFPLRPGIIMFGLINILFSVVAVTCLVITTELKKSKLVGSTSIEVVTSTILYSIFGMGIILNIMLLVASCQKDILMLRLYLYYGVVTTFAALVPAFVLLSRMMTYDVCVALFAILDVLNSVYVPREIKSLPSYINFIYLGMQWYVIVLVRSEIVKLEEANIRAEETSRVHEVIVDVPDRDTLL